MVKLISEKRKNSSFSKKKSLVRLTPEDNVQPNLRNVLKRKKSKNHSQFYVVKPQKCGFSNKSRKKVSLKIMNQVLKKAFLIFGREVPLKHQ